MRYINKEYGFTFRPPFFDKFYEEKTEGPAISEKNYPDRYIQGVGYDYTAINGAMLIGKYGSMWGIKVSYFDGKKWLDNDDFSRNMGFSCANSADGSFAHFSSGPLSVKWVKFSEQSLVVQVSARKKLRVRVIFYPGINTIGDLSIENNFVKGRSPYVGVIPGTISLADNNAVFKERYLVIDDNEKSREYFLAQSFNRPSDSANGAFNEAIMEFVINDNQPSVCMFAAVGDESVFDLEIPRVDKIIKQIETSELRYGVNKTMGTGTLGAPVERMLNSVLWSRIYYPYLMTEIYSPQRALLNKHFDIKGLEENCSAILGSYTGIDKVRGQLSYTIEDKILAAISVWHAFCHTLPEKRDAFLELYTSLTALYPPESGLAVCKKPDKNEIAYKWTDSPLKEKGNPMNMYSVDMSSLKLLAFDILERMSIVFLPENQPKYQKAKEEMIQHINDTLWDERTGLYCNRYATGDFARNYGATSFYPLLAGAVDTGEKLSALMNCLTDPSKFWGKYLVPTLSVNNPEFGRKGKPNNNGERKPPFLEYRGSIVPYVNYIIYQGLCRYGLDELAGNLAENSARLWSNNKSDNVENYSMYLPTGKRYKSREYLSSNGNMLALIGMQELLDLEYFRSDLKTASLRFGTFAEGNHSISNLKLLGHTYSIDINEGALMLVIDDCDVFNGEGGKFKVRNFILTPKAGCEFMIDAHDNITINLNIPQTKKNVKYFFIAPVGKSKIVAEHGMVNIQPITG